MYHSAITQWYIQKIYNLTVINWKCDFVTQFANNGSYAKAISVTLGLYRNRSVERIKGNQATFDNSQRNNLRSCVWVRCGFGGSVGEGVPADFSRWGERSLSFYRRAPEWEVVIPTVLSRQAAACPRRDTGESDLDFPEVSAPLEGTWVDSLVMVGV